MRIQKFKVVIFLCLLVSFSTSLQPCFAKRDNVVLAFGDSITMGYWEVDEESFVQGSRVGGYEPDLENLTDLINNHYDVLNYGLSGERTVYTPKKPANEGGINRLKNNILPKHPNARFILIMEGTNDIWSSIPRTTTVATLGLMIDEARKYGIEPILGTLTPDPRSIAHFKNIPLYNELIKVLATEKNVVLADFYTEMISEWNSKYARMTEMDPLHPSRQGYEKIAEIWFEAVALPPRIVSPMINLLLSE